MSSTVPDPNRGIASLAYVDQQGRHTFVLPLPGQKPSRALSPNGGHGHWSVVAKARRSIRTAVAWRVREARIPLDQAHVHVSLHYVPKDKRDRDSDNLVPILKPCIDALRDAKVIANDTPDYVTWTPPRIHPPDKLRPRLWLEVKLGPAPVSGEAGV